MTNTRVLNHYRFGKKFAWLNRTIRSRRKSIKKIIAIYENLRMVEDGCSLCKEDNFSLLAEGDRYGFNLKKQICNRCGLVQTYPKLGPEFHNEFYSFHYRPLYLKSKDVDYHQVINEQVKKGKLYLDLLQRNGLSKELTKISVIEIGCSSGGTINTLKPHVQSVQGCDLDINAIEFAKSNYGLNVEVAAMPSTFPDGKKLFIISHALEHVFDPLTTLQNIREISNKGDYLFIAVPGLNKVAQGDYKNDLRRYFHIAHVTDFTASTLEAMTQSAGFKMINIDEDIHGLFVADEKKQWVKNENDSIDNIRRIESSYKGSFPHL